LTADVLIRPLVEADWPTVHDLVVEVARAGETYAMDVPATVADTKGFWADPHRVVAEVDGVVLGTAKMGPNRPAQGSHVGTASFMVSAAARGRGLGRALGEYAVDWHRREGFRAIQFNAVVETNTAAVRLWQQLGFRIVGTVPGAFRRPDGSYVGLHVMLLDLGSSTGPA
jgi:GNAT superfamily N-acetyltransferase